MPQAAMPIASLAMGGLGEVGNIFGGKQQAKAAANLQNTQAQMLRNLTGMTQNIQNMTPGEIMQQAQQYQQPMSANLSTAVRNAISPQVAAMGLGQSAGQMEAAMAPILAQYQQGEQQMGNQMEQWKTLAPLAAAVPALQATTNLPQYFQQNQGAGTLLQQGLQQLFPGQGGPVRGAPAGTNYGAWNNPMVPNWSGGAFNPSAGIPDIGGGGNTGFDISQLGGFSPPQAV